MQIFQDDLTGDRITGFLCEHLENMFAVTPPESVHALGLEALRAPDITFWSVWEEDDLLGCGALRKLDPKSGEVKSMRTVVAHRGKGVASRVLEHILQEAGRRGYERLYLETGAMLEFAPARNLYLRYGFEVCGPFADYADDPNSVFMVRSI
ncbi:GNAT family N-acetyltransferase [soil metagenome]